MARALCYERGIPNSQVLPLVGVIQSQIGLSHRAADACVAKYPHAFRVDRDGVVANGDTCLKVIRIDVTVGQKSLRDKFTWNILAPDRHLCDFVSSLCTDLGLSREMEVDACFMAIQQITGYRAEIGQPSLHPEV